MFTTQEILEAQQKLQSIPENHGDYVKLGRITQHRPMHPDELAQRCGIYICNDIQSGPIYCDKLAEYCITDTRGDFSICKYHYGRIVR